MYSIVNILGLAIGIAFFTLLFLLVKHETSYDTFYKNSNRIYRMVQHMEKGGTSDKTATTPFQLSVNLTEDFPEYVEQATSIFRYSPNIDTSIEYNKKRYNEGKFFFADKYFFKVFDIPLELGDQKTALKEELSVIISAEVAQKYFGDENPLGKEIIYEGRGKLKVTGVFKEKDYNSHFDFDFIASQNSLIPLDLLNKRMMKSWYYNFSWTYLLLKKEVTPSDLEYYFPEIKAYYPQEYFDKLSFYLQPVQEIHLHSNLVNEIGENGDIKYIYIYSAIAFLILIIATINFTNLSTARYAARAREIGVRKAIGADKNELTNQFMVESLFISLVAIFIAFNLIEAILPTLSDFSAHKLQFRFINKWIYIATVLGSGLSVGFLSSLYPAYYLSSFRPSEVLGGTVASGSKSQQFRRLLIVIQFVITIFLLVSTFVSYKQFNYLKNAQLGFEKEHIIMIPLANTPAREKFPEIKEVLLKSSYISHVTSTGDIMGSKQSTYNFTMESEGKKMFLPVIYSGVDFLKTFGIKLIAGEDFTNYETDEKNSVLINKAVIDLMDWGSAEEAIGKELHTFSGNERVIGVVDNFNFASLHSKVEPIVIDIPDKRDLSWTRNFLVMRIAPQKADEAIKEMREVWYQHFPDHSFDYFFLNDKLSNQYFKEEKLGKTSADFSLVAILIACMGLFGLSSFIVVQRKKEIAIRKAIGSTNISILFFLIKEFIFLVGIAIVFSLPLSYFIMNDWLKSFPYRVTMDLEIFIASGCIALLITLLTVSYHTIKAATSDPTQALQG